MKKINGSFQLFALMNGVNIRARMGIINGPLRQEYKKGTNICSPDWETSATKPLIYAHLNRDDNGAVLNPVTLDLFYNGVQIAFGGDGLSTTGALAGVFKKSTKTVNIGGRDYPNMIVFEIVKNIVPVSNYDNDTILLKGTTEVGGQSLAFDAISETVEIVETVGSSTTLYLDGDTDVTTDSPKATLNAHILIDGTSPSDLSAYTAKWYKVEGETATLVKSGVWTLEVNASDIDGTATYRCDLLQKDGSTVLGSAYINDNDYTDPYRVNLYVDGITGEQIKEGETAIYTAKVEKDDGTEDTTAQTTFTVTDNSGAKIDSLSGVKKSINVSFQDVINAGGGLSGYVSATIVS